MRELIRNQRGAVLAMVAISLVAILGIAGLAIDGGRAYVTRAQLSRAVDAAALAGAASLRLGQATALQRIEALAAANGVDPALLDITFGVNAEGENTVTVSANRIMPTTFMRVLGQTQVDVGSVAEATVPPLDLCLVLDQSGSLGSQGAWDDLQRAAKDFVDDFDESLDQMGLVSFQTRAAEHLMLGPSFKSAMTAAIDNMTSVGFTNTGEGLRLCKNQFDNGPVRDRSIRVVVFFTDGRPTAFREMLGGEDRIMSICMTPCRIYGYYDDPDNLPMDRYPAVSGCSRVSRCFGYREPEARDRSKQFGIEQADAIRSGGTYLYTIGLGNPSASDPLIIPDYDYLKLLANEDGMANPSQPQARSYFAPSAAELQTVFKAVAQDILVRLTH